LGRDLRVKPNDVRHFGGYLKQLGVVAIVFVGLMSIMQALTFVVSNTWVLLAFREPTPENVVSSIGVLAGVALSLALGFLLLAKRHRLADRLLDDTEVDFAIDGVTLLRVAVIVFGLILLVGSAPRLIGAASAWASQEALERSYEMELTQDPSVYWTVAADALIGIIEALVGVLFLVRSQSLAERLWLGARPIAVVTRPMSACPSCGAAFDPDDYVDKASARCIECRDLLFPASV